MSQLNYEPSEKEKYIRKATEEYAARIRAMFPDAKVLIQISYMKLTGLSEIVEPMRNEEGEPVKLEIGGLFHNVNYIACDIKGNGYEIDRLSE